MSRRTDREAKRICRHHMIAWDRRVVVMMYAETPLWPRMTRHRAEWRAKILEVVTP